ncbi:hypothetical protein STENM327S_03828 [Streptomyces tendae]
MFNQSNGFDSRAIPRRHQPPAPHVSRHRSPLASGVIDGMSMTPQRPTAPTRRAVLLAAAAAALASVPGAAAAAADPYDALRRRWLGIALGTGYDPAAEPYASRLAETGARAREHRATMAPTATSLWPGHPFDPPAGITFAYGRLWTMTEAYVQQGTGSTGDAALLADILRGLDHLSATVYNPATTRYGNWWEWQIGSPRLLMDITAALHDHLGADRVAAACAAVDHFVPDAMLGDYTGTSTGANRVDLCRSVALRGVLGRAPAKLALARDALSPVFPYVTEGTASTPTAPPSSTPGSPTRGRTARSCWTGWAGCSPCWPAPSGR